MDSTYCNSDCCAELSASSKVFEYAVEAVVSPDSVRELDILVRSS